MTGKTIKALRDCTSKIKDLAPTEEKIKEMFTFLSMVDRLVEICNWEGPSGLRIEADGLPENTDYERAFKESIYMWLNGSSIDKASDHVADKYFERNPSGYDSAIYFAAIFSVGNILKGELAFSFIDQALQYLLPDGWRWREEDEKESEAHKDDNDWYPILHRHRNTFLGDHTDEIRHRFDDVKICNLITVNDIVSEVIGKSIADRLPGYKDGALQLILKKLKYPDLEKALYVLPEEAENRIISNLSDSCIPVIKGNCILNKDSIDPGDIKFAVMRFAKAMKAYDGDRSLDAGYE